MLLRCLQDCDFISFENTYAFPDFLRNVRKYLLALDVSGKNVNLGFISRFFFQLFPKNYYLQHF